MCGKNTGWYSGSRGVIRIFYARTRFLFSIYQQFTVELSQYSVWLRTGWPGFDPRQGQRIFPLTSASRPALGPTQLSIQWVPGVLSLGVKRGRSVMLTTHTLLVPRLRKSRSCTSSHPNAPVWSVTGPLYLLFTLRAIYRTNIFRRINYVSKSKGECIYVSFLFAEGCGILKFEYCLYTAPFEFNRFKHSFWGWFVLADRVLQSIIFQS
jgi:hypothetical protein